MFNAVSTALHCKLFRDPYYPWDVPTLRRNFGEPLQVDSIIFENLSTPTQHFRRTGTATRKIGSLTWTAPSDTPGKRCLPVRLPGLALSSSACGLPMERMAFHCKNSLIGDICTISIQSGWSVQWRVNSWSMIITTLSRTLPGPGKSL